MLNNGNSSTAYNNFSVMPTFPYSIIEHLILNGSEELWKLLKYQTIDALDQPNLTAKEKKKLVWDGIDPLEEKYNIFLKPLIGNSLDSGEEQCQIRIYRYDTIPISRLQATVVYEFDIICQEKCANVYYNDAFCERTDLIEALLLKDLNGVDIKGTGDLVFDRNLSRTCKSLMNISNSKSFYGRSLFLAQTIIMPDSDGC
jgi:hypothetical protein